MITMHGWRSKQHPRGGETLPLIVVGEVGQGSFSRWSSDRPSQGPCHSRGPGPPLVRAVEALGKALGPTLRESH